MPFAIFESDSRTILSPVSGFLKEAGFTHSLTPARNCTFGCTYCYVPTMRVQAGLKPEDWQRWGQQTTFKRNASELLARELRGTEIVYCAPLTDPYQPAEAEQGVMRGILQAIINSARPPKAFVIQTRGPLILRDLNMLLAAGARTRLRVSFSVTTDREDVRRIFEPNCSSLEARWDTIRVLREAGVAVTATLAPLLPCNPDGLLDRALQATDGPVVGDPLHVRATKQRGATTRDPALEICRRYNWAEWLDPDFQSAVLHQMQRKAVSAGRLFSWGPRGFGLLSADREQSSPNGVYNCAGEKT